MGPGSLYSEIMTTPPDPCIYPEVEWDAEVRLGEELCIAERAFLGERRRVIKASFSKLIGVPEDDINEHDIPIVAIAGSGGGRSFRLVRFFEIDVLALIKYIDQAFEPC